MKYDELLSTINATLDKRFEAQRELLDERFTGQRELYEAKTTHMMAETRLMFDDLHDKQTEMLKKQDVTNGRVNKLESGTRWVMWVNKNKRLVAILGVVGWFVLAFLADHVNLLELWKLIK